MQQRHTLDRFAMWTSGLCIVHCFASVAGLFSLGLLSAFGWMEEWMHPLLLLAIIPATGIAIFTGYRRHQQRKVLWLAMPALSALIIIALLEPWLHDFGWLEPALTSVAGIGLILAHLHNIRACNDCAHTSTGEKHA